ncbi:MAG: PQQ-binding-like beta-propeller repeat protein [Candidatus Brachytrichaceae bacterium NZ_4S206]|jgi:outer membrane protein assembly factor BamB
MRQAMGGKFRIFASVAWVIVILAIAANPMSKHAVAVRDAATNESTAFSRASARLAQGEVLSPTMYLPVLLSQQPAAGPTPTPTIAPPTSGDEWSQHAHDPQRTGYTAQVVAPPWRWRWSWNGPNNTGGISAGKTGLPRNVQPVTGGGRVYVAAGNRGVYALRETDGVEVWNARPGGNINSTVAYDRDTQSVFALSSNGTLYKLNAANGSVTGQFATGAGSALPLPPAVLSDRVLFAIGNRAFAVNKTTMQQIWVYQAGAEVHTPPAYSVSRNRVIIATADLHVHAIENSNGNRAWRVRPVHASLAAGETPDGRNFAEVKNGWPVVADGAGYVLIKVRLDWESMWRDWPQTNSAMRAFLTANPTHQALFVLDLDDGSIPFIANVGHGGYGDGGYMPMGPQPVVKRLPNGKEVVYTIIRAKHSGYDPRGDSHFGEMMLDSSTVSGLQGGDVRFIYYDWPPGNTNPYLITDEQPNVSMAGDYLFGGHWEAGFALRILDRSDARGSFSNKITTQRLDTIATSQDGGGCSFSASHYCASGLQNTRGYDRGFYIYYNQGAVYDRYWGEYAIWTVSNNNLYFRSTDGAIVALTSGSPTVASTPAAEPVSLIPPMSLVAHADLPTIPYTQAGEWSDHVVTVEGVLRYVFNNGKQVLLGFEHPHQGAFKALIRKVHWPAFGGAPEARYRAGDRVRVTGLIEWYQGDPAIYVTEPAQIQPQP